MIDIYKASAGSGKTYQLSKTYRDLLLNNTSTDSAYRNILAVTFTNKATEEMKDRILKDLSDAARTDAKARRILINLLHDYGSFSVSTIDKFFQQALRAFSREIGYSNNYQIELDKDSLIEEAADRIIDELSEDQKELLNWIRNQYNRSLQSGEKPDLEKSITDIGKEFCKLPEQERSLLTKDRLESLRKKCTDITSAYYKKVSAAARAVDKVGTKQQGALDKMKNADKTKSICFTSRFPSLIQKYPHADELVEILEGKEAQICSTAEEIEKTLFTLGFREEFFTKLGELEKEKNVLSLDESTELLKKIIGESDAPFIYEKLGVRYNHFLLDEFQDTSRVQWENFRPLLENSVAEKNKSMIVGDVKQSIYRWRDSDWKLLNEEIQSDFPGAFRVIPLQDNWRSNSAIVNFNNEFFTFAAQSLGLDTTIYNDVLQNVKISDDGIPGRVTVKFFSKEEEKNAEPQLGRILSIINEARENGAELSDIAILARRKEDGSKIASFLIDNGLAVISNDSLLLSSSSIVSALSAVLHCIDNPSDTLSQFTAKELDLNLNRSYHSLLDLCDSILNDLKKIRKADFDSQTLFIQSFMDYLLNWVNINGNNLHQFLKAWDEKADKLTISSPEGTQAVRIMTIHKSKGLAFPIVIFPYAEKISDVHKTGDRMWFKMNDGAEDIFGFNMYFPLQYSAKLGKTLFSNAYEQEVKLRAIDNLNLFYVCLTRAKKEMHIISGEPYDGSVGSLLKDKYGSEFTSGSPYSAFHPAGQDSKKKACEALRWDAFYENYAMNPEGREKRFVSSSDAWDFFEEEGIGQSRRRKGIELHALLSQIESVEDVDRVINQENEETADFIRSRVLSKPQWFSTEMKALNESSIIDSYGNICRPDRVIISPEGEVTIIDFKFGEEKAQYHKQVRRYMSLFNKMGYKQVKGYLWYVYPDKTEEVAPNADLL